MNRLLNLVKTFIFLLCFGLTEQKLNWACFNFPDSLLHRVAVAESLLFLDPKGKEKAVKVVEDAIKLEG